MADTRIIHVTLHDTLYYIRTLQILYCEHVRGGVISHVDINGHASYIVGKLVNRYATTEQYSISRKALGVFGFTSTMFFHIMAKLKANI